MRLRGLTAALGICLVAVFVGTVAAQTTTSTEMKKFEVISVDGNQLVLRGTDGKSKQFTVPADFKFNVDGQMVSVSELKPGMKGMATITTTTTVTPVTVTEVKNGTVTQVVGNTIIVRLPDGTMKMFSQGDVDKRQARIMKDGQPVMLSQLHANDTLTATIVTEHPPKVVTQRQVDASLASGQPPAMANTGHTPGAAPAACERRHAGGRGTPAAEDRELSTVGRIARRRVPGYRRGDDTASSASGLIAIGSPGIGPIVSSARSPQPGDPGCGLLVCGRDLDVHRGARHRDAENDAKYGFCGSSARTCARPQPARSRRPAYASRAAS